MKEHESRKSSEVYQFLRAHIDQNLFSSNHKMPSENVICRKFNVSRTTARSAIATLINEGLLYTKRGSGTYINKAVASAYRGDLIDHRDIKIGVILQGQDADANNTLMAGLHSVLNPATTSVSTFYTDNRFASERSCLEAVAKQNFSGFIVDGVKSTLLNPNLDCYHRFYEKQTPMIFYNNYYANLNYPKVIIDDHTCANQLVSRLIEAGHRNIAGIFVCDNHQSVEKFHGYVQTLHANGIKFNDDHVKWCISNEAHDPRFVRSIGRFLKSVPKCTAIVCCNLMILNLVQRTLQETERSIPRDYSVVCFDYSKDDWTKLGITCSIHPGYEMGRQLGKQLLQMIKHKNFDRVDYSAMISSQIYHGLSIAPPKQQGQGR